MTDQFESFRPEFNPEQVRIHIIEIACFWAEEAFKNISTVGLDNTPTRPSFNSVLNATITPEQPANNSAGVNTSVMSTEAQAMADQARLSIDMLWENNTADLTDQDDVNNVT
jgi:hypothetical protein